VIHAFLDGVAIGLGFQVSTEVGWIVAIAVLTHAFADGLNTVSVMLSHGGQRKHAMVMLGLAAAAPVLGAASTTLFEVPASVLPLYLGAFAGFIIYLAAAHILPEAHSHHPSRLTLLATVIGVLLMWGVVGVTHEGHQHGTDEAHESHEQHGEDEHDQETHDEESSPAGDSTPQAVPTS
jgi:ZIP family zinc transporter